MYSQESNSAIIFEAAGTVIFAYMDRAVRKTDDDAAASKYSAVLRGYYKDNYIQYFTPKPRIRLPLINIGTYCRVKSIDAVVHEFLASSKSFPNRAIVSLGAGSDTRPFRILSQYENVEYHEIDFKTKIDKKLAIISAYPELQHDRYYCHALDLREFSPENLPSHETPLLVISECCMCYLSPESAFAVLSFFPERFHRIWAVLYEPISRNDQFGQVMAENLTCRGLNLQSFQALAKTEANISRLERAGFRNVSAHSILDEYHELDAAEKTRLSRLEFLDEVEEMNLLLYHYLVVVSKPTMGSP